MKSKTTLLITIVACVVLATLAFAAAACSSGDTTTTAAPATTTTAAAPAGTDTTAGATDTTAAGVTVPSIEMTPDVQTYLGQLTVAMGSLQALPDSTDPFKMDPATVTDAQIASSNDALAQVQKALDALKALTPPDSLKTIHETLVNAFSSEIDVAKKAIEALKNKDQAALTAAKAESDKIDQQMTDFFNQLVPMMSGGTTATS